MEGCPSLEGETPLLQRATEHFLSLAVATLALTINSLLPVPTAELLSEGYAKGLLGSLTPWMMSPWSFLS
jgi:hypothetical protein